LLKLFCRLLILKHKLATTTTFIDPETGLYYYRARYYNPRIGRFLGEDPVGYIDGINLYTYCGNNPVNWIDPFGLCKEEEDPWWKLALPDYINLTGNVAIVNPWTHTLIGISGQVIIDRYGRVYVGAGPTVGRAATIISGSLTGGWILREERLRRIPTESELSSFLTRHSYNVGGGYIGGGQMTYVPGSGYALEIGGFTPQVGGGYHYTWQKWDKDISW